MKIKILAVILMTATFAICECRRELELLQMLRLRS